MIALLFVVLFCLAAPRAKAWEIMDWGPISRDLRIAVSSEAPVYQADKPIMIRVLLENVGADLTTYPPCVEWSWYSFEIRDPNGVMLPGKPNGLLVCSWSPSSWTIQSHEIVRSEFDLRQKYDLSLPGDYQITATSSIYLPAEQSPDGKWNHPLYTTLRSNTIHITLREVR